MAKIDIDVEGPTAPDAPWFPPTLPEWLDNVDEGRPWLVERFIPADSFVLLSGQQKLTFKTFFAFACAFAVASGRRASLVRPVSDHPLPVLIIEEEGAESETKRRVLALAKAMSIPVQLLSTIHFACRQRVKLDDPRWRDRLMNVCARIRPRLIVLDAMYCLHDGDENNVGEMTETLETMQLLREISGGASLLYLAHLIKDARPSDDIDRQLRGSSVLTNVYDMHLAARKYKDNNDPIELHTRNRGGPSALYSVRWEMSNRVSKDGAPLLDTAKPHIVQCVLDTELAEHCITRTRPGVDYRLGDLRAAWGISVERVQTMIKVWVDSGRFIEGNDAQGEVTWRLRNGNNVLDSNNAGMQQ